VTPTGRTLAYLRDAGYLADVTERWIPHRNIRRDLFGIGDVLAVHPARQEFLLIQATTAAHVGDRLARVKGKRRPELTSWLQAGGRFECWGWVKRDGRWHLKRAVVRPEDLQTVFVQSLPRRNARPQRMLFE
jgi:hypothetical protein